MVFQRWGRGKGLFIILGMLLLSLPAMTQGAIIYSFDIFTDNGAYDSDPRVKLVAEVSGGYELAKFRFYNNSTVDCVLADIFFDDGSLLGIDTLLNGPGTLFHRDEKKKNLPAGEDLTPDFVADREFTIGADNPAPENGVSNITVPAKKWVEVDFVLADGCSVQDVFRELNTGELRVGTHIIAFPDKTSESAILVPTTGQIVPDNPDVPEPVSLILLISGAAALLRRRTA